MTTQKNRKPTRMDILGQNGNDGLHHRKHEHGAEEYNIKEKEKKDKDGNRLSDIYRNK